MAATISTTGFYPDPVNNEHTLTTPESFDGFVIGDDVLITRGEKIVTRAKVVDRITRESTGNSQLVLSGINRRTVKENDVLESLENSRTRFVETVAEITLS